MEWGPPFAVNGAQVIRREYKNHAYNRIVTLRDEIIRGTRNLTGGKH